MKPRAPVRPPTATGSNLPSGSDVFRSSQPDGVNPAVVGTTPVAVGVGVGPEAAGEHDARRIAEIIKAFISTPILMAPHRLRSRCLSSPHGPTAVHAAEEVRDARQTIERVRGEV